MRNISVRGVMALAVVALLATAAACGGDEGDADAGPVTVRLLTHDSFTVEKGTLAAFTRQTGIKVRVVKGGDAGSVVNQAILTKGKPQGDVLFGVDSTFLTRALDEGIFLPHEADGLHGVAPALAGDAEHRVTPIDYGDVCLNFDRAWFTEHGVSPPASLRDLTKPAYRDLLVVENPATSSPGLAFLLASIDELGDDWQGWWRDLRANGVEVVNGWEEAYYGSFSGGGGSEGKRPLVVSYASSPPAEVVYADPPIDNPPTGVVDSGCYRQVEYAGVLAGTEHEDEAGQLVDFLLSPRFQRTLPLSMFVFPAVTDTELPDVFVEHAARPTEVLELAPKRISANRERWIDEWTTIVLR